MASCARCKLLLLKEFDKAQWKHNGHLAHANCVMAGHLPGSRDYLAAQKLLVDEERRRRQHAAQASGAGGAGGGEGGGEGGDGGSRSRRSQQPTPDEILQFARLVATGPYNAFVIIGGWSLKGDNLKGKDHLLIKLTKEREFSSMTLEAFRELLLGGGASQGAGGSGGNSSKRGGRGGI